MNSRSRNSLSAERVRERGPLATAGFTLLEVLIAMAILVFISLGIYQATVQTYRLRDILSNEGDFYNQIRLAMDIVQRDVATLYSPGIMIPKPAPSVTPGIPGMPAVPQPPPQNQFDPELQAVLTSDLGQTSQFWMPTQDKTGIRASRFTGTENKMSFISLSHARLYRESKESDFAKVTFETTADSDDRTGATLVLLKSENADAFRSDDSKEKENTRTFRLLGGITKINFKYLKKDKDQWKEYKSWDTESEEFKDSYPDIIEVNLSVSGPTRLSFEGTYKFRPEVPLNGIDPSF